MMATPRRGGAGPAPGAALLLAAAVAGVVPARADVIDDYLRGELQTRRIPGLAVAIIKDGVVTREITQGLASLELGAPVKPTTVFPIASTSKIFAATSILLLVQDGRLSLDRNVRAILPALPAAWDGVTVREILSHTSGLPDIGDEPQAGGAPGTTREAILARLAGLPLAAPPGTTWAYNQVNYLLAGMIVEAVSGRPYTEFVSARILAPLGMTATSFGDSREVVPQRATWYTLIEDNGDGPRLADRLRVHHAFYPPWLYPAAGVNTTLADLVRFDRALGDDAFLRRDLREAMWTNTTLRDGTPLRLQGYAAGWGLGWWVRESGGRRSVGMSGASTVAMQRYLDDHLTIIVLTNLQGAQPESLLDGLADRVLPAAGPRKPAPGSADPRGIGSGGTTPGGTTPDRWRP